MASKNEKEAAKLGISLKEYKKLKKSGGSYKTTSEYQSLSPDEQKLADLQFEVQSGSSKYTTKQLKDALKQAKKDSSGYMKNILREFETSVSNEYASQTGDYQSALDTINENIKEINEDLVKNRDNLTLEEQQVLVRQARDYEQTRGQLVNQIAGTGTTFSSIGTQQKEYAEETQKGIVEGITSTYDKQITDLEIAAERGNKEAQKKIEDLNRARKEGIQSLGLKAESYLGTEKTKGLGLDLYTPLGDITGQYKEDLTKDIAARQETYLDKSKQTSLNF